MPPIVQSVSLIPDIGGRRRTGLARLSAEASAFALSVEAKPPALAFGDPAAVLRAPLAPLGPVPVASLMPWHVNRHSAEVFFTISLVNLQKN